MESNQNLGEFLYKRLVSKYGDQLIHSAKIVREKVKDPFDKKVEIIEKRVRKEVTEKGFLGFPRKVIYEEIIEEKKTIKVPNAYGYSYNDVSRQLDEGEEIVFTINGCVYFTNLKVYFWSFPYEDKKCLKEYDRENPWAISRVTYDTIVELNEKHCASGWNDGIRGGCFSTEEWDNPFSEDYGKGLWFFGFGEDSTGSPGLELFGPPGYSYSSTKCKTVLPSSNDAPISNFINDLINEYLPIQRKRIQESLLSFIAELDSDNNGKVDFIEGNDYQNLLSKCQTQIISIDKEYIQKFVKIGGYLKTKKENIQTIFDYICKDESCSFLENEKDSLRNQIHSYNLLLFHSLNMITALIEGNMIVFYEIYEALDELGIFDSNWEKEVSQKLSKIEHGLKELTSAIERMERKVVNAIDNLSYVTQQSFAELNQAVTHHLKEINSNVNFNNLLTTIQTYQLYRINKKTKLID